MANYCQAVVTEIIEQRRGLQRVVVERTANNHNHIAERANVLTDLVGNCSVGDKVAINTTALDLQLGTGGWHFVSANLSQPEHHNDNRGHIIKLRYTPLQTDFGVVEETENYLDVNDVQEMPVIGCFLHSQLGVVATTAKFLNPDFSIAYVMTDSAGLAYPLSDLANSLRESGVLAMSITAGQSFGGDLESVNIATAIGIAHSRGADMAIVAPGPGVVGTASKYGFGSLDVASTMQLATALNASPVLCARYSTGDARTRHQGLSHHSRTVLEVCKSPMVVPTTKNNEISVPEPHRTVTQTIPSFDQVGERFGIEVTTMGRNSAADKGFFEVSAAAGSYGVDLATQRREPQREMGQK